MANDKQLAESSLIKFLAWLDSKTDYDYRSLESRGVIARKEIAKTTVLKARYDVYDRTGVVVAHSDEFRH